MYRLRFSFGFAMPGSCFDPHGGRNQETERKKRTWCRSVRYGQTEGPHLHDASHLQSAYLHHWHHALHLNTFTSHASASPHVRLEPPGTGFGGFESTERPTASPWVTEPPSTRLTGTEPTRVAVREAARNGGAMAVATCDGVTRTSSGRESFGALSWNTVPVFGVWLVVLRLWEARKLNRTRENR